MLQILKSCLLFLMLIFNADVSGQKLKTKYIQARSDSIAIISC